MIVGLSKKSDLLIGLLFKKYMERLEAGADGVKANDFGSLENIQKEVAPDWDMETIAKSCIELYEGDFIYAFITPEKDHQIPKNITLTQKAVLYMQSRKADEHGNFDDDPMNVLGFFLKE